MQQEIAVILNQNQQLTKLQEANTLLVYKEEDTLWNVHKEISVHHICDGSLPEVRDNISRLVNELGDCRIIIGTNITGIVYNVLNQAGFVISELQTFHESMLDSIYQEISIELMDLKEGMETNKIVPTRPYETHQKDHYFFDFNLLKGSNSSHTSKSTILPFLNSTTFTQLEILCDHVMPGSMMK